MSVATLLVCLLASPAAAPDVPVLLDFHAEWCGPCQQMRPAIEQLSANGYPVKSIDIDRSKTVAARYRVREVPTFIVVDPDGRELARTKGLQPASELATLYGKAKARLESSENKPLVREDDDRDDDAAPDRRLPRPWETVVRIRISSRHSEGIGSGTVIHSTPDESVILTCAHIFHVGGARQYAPSQFALPIAVDLFDGQLHGLHPAVVHPVETVAAKVIDYDFATDLGLIRIRPGRKLPATLVVPADWQPKKGLDMTTVGCSEGRNATAWSTKITNPLVRGMVNNARYEAIECQWAPRQGRSGGGLYTIDGYVAGVCDFAEPHGNHGLYASPRSIHAMLDRNSLTVCYNPTAPGPELLAARSRASSAGTKLRGQNPSPEGRELHRITLPDPEIVGVRTPALAAAKTGASTRTGRAVWKSPAKGREQARDSGRELNLAADSATNQSRMAPADIGERPIETEMEVDAEAAARPLVEPAAEPEERATTATSRGGWRAVRPIDRR
jgi:thiol-disulfide isomerase/thioredoxin